MSDNTPTLMQSEEARAPWNEEHDAIFEYEVTITETITRKFKVDATSDDKAKEKAKKNISSANAETSENSQNNTQSSVSNKKNYFYFLL